jgi:hypothetical protein
MTFYKRQLILHLLVGGVAGLVIGFSYSPLRGLFFLVAYNVLMALAATSTYRIYKRRYDG